MIDDETKASIERTVITAFSRWSQRNNEYLLAEEAEGSPQQKLEVREKARQDFLCLSKRALIPGFDRYMVKQMRSNPILRRRRPILIKSCIISMIRDEGAKIDESRKLHQSDIGDENGDSAQSARNEVSRRHFQRYTHEEFKELFFPSTDDSPRKKTEDKRFSPISSVFAPIELPQAPNSEKARMRDEWDHYVSTRDQDAVKRVTLNSFLRPVTPEYLEDLLDFRNECTQILAEIGEYTERAEYLASELKQFSLILNTFHAHFTSILGVYWYRSRHPPKKKELMKRGFPLQYSASDAQQAKQLLLTLIDSKEKVAEVMQMGAKSLFEYSLYDSFDYLTNQCLSLDIPQKTRGAIAESAAYLHRTKENYKQTHNYAKQAYEHAKAANDNYLSCITLRDIAEAEWQMNLKTTALEHFKTVEEKITTLQQPAEHFAIYLNLACAFKRTGEPKTELYYLKKALDYSDAVEPKLSIELDKRLSQLTTNI